MRSEKGSVRESDWKLFSVSCKQTVLEPLRVYKQSGNCLSEFLYGKWL